MVQARRLAFTLNGHSLTSGVLSRIDFTNVLLSVNYLQNLFSEICLVNIVSDNFDQNLITKRTDLASATAVSEIVNDLISEVNEMIGFFESQASGQDSLSTLNYRL